MGEKGLPEFGVNLIDSFLVLLGGDFVVFGTLKRKQGKRRETQHDLNTYLNKYTFERLTILKVTKTLTWPKLLIFHVPYIRT